VAAPDAADFLDEYPEFRPFQIPSPGTDGVNYIQAVLNRADRRIGVSWDENVRDDIVMLQAACMLANSPAGRAAKMVNAGSDSSYDMALKERKKANAFAKMRIVT
jgi:hypothetical protein